MNGRTYTCGPTCDVFRGLGACLGRWGGQQRGAGELAHGSLQGSGRTVQGVRPSYGLRGLIRGWREAAGGVCFFTSGCGRHLGWFKGKTALISYSSSGQGGHEQGQ